MGGAPCLPVTPRGRAACPCGDTGPDTRAPGGCHHPTRDTVTAGPPPRSAVLGARAASLAAPGVTVGDRSPGGQLRGLGSGQEPLGTSRCPIGVPGVPAATATSS